MQFNLFGDYENCLTYISPKDLARLSPVALEVNQRLSQVYEVPDLENVRLDLLNQLIYSILSQRTKSRQTDEAFEVLLRRFSDWRELLDMPVQTLEHMIVMVTFADQKARWLQTALQQIEARNDGRELSLDYIHNMFDVEASAELRKLYGVGWKTSHATMLLSEEHRALLPVDTHGKRVRKRLGIIAENLEDTKSIHAISRALLPADWQAQEIEREYFVLKRHGQNCCTYSDPDCGKCPLRDICQFGKNRITWPHRQN